jgi:hypothetical protein
MGAAAGADGQRRRARMPGRGAEIAGAEGPQEPQRLVDVATDVEVVDPGVPDDPFRIDDERPAERGPVFQQDAECFAHGLGGVGQHRVIHV